MRRKDWCFSLQDQDWDLKWLSKIWDCEILGTTQKMRSREPQNFSKLIQDPCFFRRLTTSTHYCIACRFQDRHFWCPARIHDLNITCIACCPLTGKLYHGYVSVEYRYFIAFMHETSLRDNTCINTRREKQAHLAFWRKSASTVTVNKYDPSGNLNGKTKKRNHH